MNFRADLHCHSTCSDGTASPREIITLASQIGLSGISITDHDTIEAYDMLKENDYLGPLQVLPGVEFSTSHRGKGIHILGYAFNENSPVIKDFCNKHKERRINRYLAILDRLKTHGMIITNEEVLECSLQGTVGRPHIAQAMLKKGYVKSIDEAFKRFIGDNKPCYTPGESFSTEETIQIIHQSGGIAAIAHPMLIKNAGIIKELLVMDFDAIEGHYARFGSNEEQEWIDIGTQRNWIITGGSDFHGDIKPLNALGSSWVDETTFNTLMNHYRKAKTFL